MCMAMSYTRCYVSIADLSDQFRYGPMLADSPGEIDPRAYLGAARDAMQRIVAERMQQFGQAERVV